MTLKNGLHINLLIVSHCHTWLQSVQHLRMVPYNPKIWGRNFNACNGCSLSMQSVTSNNLFNTGVNAKILHRQNFIKHTKCGTFSKTEKCNSAERSKKCRTKIYGGRFLESSMFTRCPCSHSRSNIWNKCWIYICLVYKNGKTKRKCEIKLHYS